VGIRGQYRNKRDGNEKAIVAAFLAHGCSVERMDVPADLLVGYRGQTHLVEVKQEGKRLNAKQREFEAAWRGDFEVVRSVDDVADLVAAWNNPD